MTDYQMVLEPLSDRVLIRRDVRETTDAGIVLLDGAASETLIGTVLAIGDGRYTTEGGFIPTTLQVGDRVIFAAFAKELRINNETLVMAHEYEVYARIVDASVADARDVERRPPMLQ